MLEILTTGAANCIQDLGRPGYLDIGVSRCGAMDRPALALGNALLGNEDNAAGLEIAVFPFRMKFHAPVQFAITGASGDFRLDGKRIPALWSMTAEAGQTLALQPPEMGARSYLTFRGGIDVQPVLGSRSTDLKSGFGGLDGQGLARGDWLPIAPDAPTGPGLGIAEEPFKAFDLRDAIPVRCIPAAEFSQFKPYARDAILTNEWLVTGDANRMGYRLEGERLELERPLELLSHGILPGTVQVPPAGKPIIQLADANTCGGYPKIATVIEADLWRIAQAPVGARLRFVETTLDEANAELARQANQINAVRDAARHHATLKRSA
jgi:5-oxoprolinase (ATP-hydrolysing) subunit C